MNQQPKKLPKLGCGMLILLIIIAALIKTCFFKETVPTPEQTTANIIASKYANRPLSKTDKYEIMSTDTDDDGRIDQLIVFAKDTNTIKLINKSIFNGYKSDGVSFLTIYYFNNRKMASEYKDKLLDENTSDKTIDKMGKHLIGKFYYDGQNDTQDLHLGENSDLF